MLVGYARCSTVAQDLTAQCDAMSAVGVKPDRICVGHNLAETNQARPGGATTGARLRAAFSSATTRKYHYRG